MQQKKNRNNYGKPESKKKKHILKNYEAEIIKIVKNRKSH